jgi:hypothetical protein
MQRALKKAANFNKVLYSKKLALLLWFGLAAFAILLNIFINHLNNFTIFRQVFYHTLQHQNLYLPYPAEYRDVNLYGPVFSLLIMPFALLPLKAGAFCWVMANCLFLWFAINTLPVNYKWKIALLLLCSHELMTTSSWQQSNAFVAACIILGFSYIQKEKDWAALFFIMLATFVKIYGITALAFFFFSKQKLRFIGWVIVWSIVFFLLPMVIGGFHFIVQSYTDWYNGLQIKSSKNIRLDIDNFYQDISVMGFIRRTFYSGLNDAFILFPATILFGSQYILWPYFSNIRYRLYLLCSVLIFTVIFSTGSENPTYIIALPGICLWYLMQPKTKWLYIFFIFLLFITTFSYSDILTPWFREHIAMRYSIKAVPGFIVWITIIFQMHTKRFLQLPDPALEPA